MIYKDLLELTRKHPNPFYTNQPSLKYRAYIESSRHQEEDRSFKNIKAK